jgi:ferritin-like metal-binding protein YciE
MGRVALTIYNSIPHQWHIFLLSWKNNFMKKQNSKNTVVNGKEQANDSKLAAFFHDELKDIYWAEKHLVKTLPKMQKAATTDELASAFEDHLEVTKEHVTRLEKVFEMLGHKAQAKKCDAMEGITKEGDSIIEDTEEGTATRDVGLIMAAQKVEHYEIATYGSLHQLAVTLGYDDVASVLETTLAEEKEADQALTAIAENDINYEAVEEEE